MTRAVGGNFKTPALLINTSNVGCLASTADAS